MFSTSDKCLWLGACLLRSVCGERRSNDTQWSHFGSWPSSGTTPHILNTTYLKQHTWEEVIRYLKKKTLLFQPFLSNQNIVLPIRNYPLVYTLAWPITDPFKDNVKFNKVIAVHLCHLHRSENQHLSNGS